MIWVQTLALDNQQCVEVGGASTADQAQINMWYCGYSVGPIPNHRLWYMTNITGNYWRISNRRSGKCMVSKYHGTANGTPMVQETCTNHNSGLFQLSYRYNLDGTDMYWLAQRSSGKCVRLPDTNANGAKLMLGDCDTDAGTEGSYFSAWTWSPPN